MILSSSQALLPTQAPSPRPAAYLLKRGIRAIVGSQGHPTEIFSMTRGLKVIWKESTYFSMWVKQLCNTTPQIISHPIRNHLIYQGAHLTYGRYSTNSSCESQSKPRLTWMPSTQTGDPFIFLIGLKYVHHCYSEKHVLWANHVYFLLWLECHLTDRKSESTGTHAVWALREKTIRSQTTCRGPPGWTKMWTQGAHSGSWDIHTLWTLRNTVSKLKIIRKDVLSTKTWLLMKRQTQLTITILKVIHIDCFSLNSLTGLAALHGMWELAPQPGMEPIPPPAMEGRSLNH